MKKLNLASLVLLALAGCSSNQIGADETNKAFPKKSDAEIESALKNDPAALAEYQKSKREAASGQQ